MREDLRQVWSNAIARDWAENRISSERDLQACLYFHLRSMAPAREIFVEPRILVGGRQMRPDLVLLDGPETWVMELKVQHASGAGVVWKGDFGKFTEIANALRRSTNEDVLQLEARGGLKERRPLGRNVHFVFACTADHTCEALDLASLKPRGIELLAGSGAHVLAMFGDRDAPGLFKGPEVISAQESRGDAPLDSGAARLRSG